MSLCCSFVVTVRSFLTRDLLEGVDLGNPVQPPGSLEHPYGNLCLPVARPQRIGRSRALDGHDGHLPVYGRIVDYRVGPLRLGESVAEPIKYYKNNLQSFLNILDAARNHGGCNVLFSSSATVYGETDKLPVTEESPRQPAQSSYGATKQICEDILVDVVRATGAYGKEIHAGVKELGPVKGIALRYFNPIGAHPSALIGELPRGVPNNLVPFITQTAIGKRECLSIFGNDYPTPDGTCLRDYIDVVDLAKAHVAAVSRMLDGKMKKDYEIFNIGTGRPVSVLELVTKFEKVNNLKLNYRFAPRRPGDITAIWADTSLANKELGWKAERSVEETLEAAWKWECHLAGK